MPKFRFLSAEEQRDREEQAEKNLKYIQIAFFLFCPFWIVFIAYNIYINDKKNEVRIEREYREKVSQGRDKLSWCEPSGGAFQEYRFALNNAYPVGCFVAGSQVVRDEFTGCQYLVGNRYKTPRVDENEKPICKKD